jgi:hypothetical protein
MLILLRYDVNTRPDVRLGEHRSKVVRSQKDVEAVAVTVGYGGGGRGRLVKSQEQIGDGGSSSVRSLLSV